jgi:hypothetical protein
MSAAERKAPAKRAVKKAAATEPKMVLGWISEAPSPAGPCWDVVLIPHGKKKALEEGKAVEGRFYVRIPAATQQAALKAAQTKWAERGAA